MMDGRSIAASLKRESQMRKTFTIVALLILIGGPAAIAQSRSGSGDSMGASGASSDRRGAADAPVGHRQPRASDVSTNSASYDPMRPSAEDAALDRRIKSICRGC